MRGFGFSRLSLLWKILLSTSVAITVLFAFTGWIVENNALTTTSRSLDDEVQASFQAYRSLLQSRARLLASVSLVLSAMSDVRAAFNTGDEVTIRDTAGELWSKVSEENALFLVTSPTGRLIASLGGVAESAAWRELEVVPAAARHFPKQASGFMLKDGHLYQVAVTPVYVQSGRGLALLDVLVAGFVVDHLVAQSLKESTGGSEFLFLSQGRVIASTLNPRATAELARAVAARTRSKSPDRGSSGIQPVSDGVVEYAPLPTPLQDIDGRTIGELWIFRSFENARQRLALLRREFVLLGVFAMLAGLGLTYLLAHNIMRPVEKLDRAAAEIAHQNYDYRVPVNSRDELGRLAVTFNNMCASIQSARQELIRQERISTIGRLSSSIVHDLRNPLAAIYGGAELMVDSDIAPPQLKRLAGNIYRASRRIQELLQDLVNVGRGKTDGAEICRLREVAAAACDSLAQTADVQHVPFRVDIPESIELPLERARVERVFINLIGNALEAMPNGGEIRIDAAVDSDAVTIQVSDTGPGISPEIRDHLFQPFVSSGKKNGLGLGLALSRQTILDHGGDMWAESGLGQGARFCFRLPLTRTAPRTEDTVAAPVARG
ncbi:MAG: sensor histidine kinase [Acidobacteriia bacterium]|nr:sensor histidine kinase [Terriglobia bacterium]